MSKIALALGVSFSKIGSKTQLVSSKPAGDEDYQNGSPDEDRKRAYGLNRRILLRQQLSDSQS
jgi:hypothetical protein